MYKQVWSNFNQIPGRHAEVNTLLVAGKSLYNLFGKKLISSLHEWWNPAKDRTERVGRRVYYETLYDHIDPDNRESSVEKTAVDVKNAKDTVGAKLDTKNDKIIVEPLTSVVL